jgi:signal transduction histidine kinase
MTSKVDKIPPKSTYSNPYKLEPEGSAGTYQGLGLVHNLVTATLCINAEGQIIDANKAACQITQRHYQELLTMFLDELIPTITHQGWVRQWELLKQEGTLIVKTHLHAQNQEPTPVELVLIHINMEGRELSQVLIRNTVDVVSSKVTVDDIRQLQLLNEVLPPSLATASNTKITQLETSLGLLKATLEATTHGVLTISQHGNVLHFNQAFADIWQIPDSIILSKECKRAQAFFENQVQHTDVFRNSVWDISLQSEFERYDVIELKDGRFLAQCSKPHIFDNKIVGRVWSLWDITAYRSAESKNQPKTNSLAIQHSQDLAKQYQIAEFRSRLISLMCNQFRSLLNIVSFSNSLLKRYKNQWDEDRKQPYFGHIGAAVEQISDLLDDTVLFAKSEVGELSFQPRIINLSEFCQVLSSDILVMSDGSLPAIHVVHQGNENLIFADPDLLKLILTKLLINAIHYSPNNTAIEFKTFTQVDQIVFQIQDQGIGISSSDQQYLFEPFFRGDNVGSIPGKGLGLAIARNLVKLHGGTITITSCVNQGTIVVVTIPAIHP